eukprot:CAMPEP_0170271276 /NCGR_PEP_ID=MMETSP0116_2-20130129/35586_1 /TAXON_ID=400756 /ORGANISM="Durinskia baltica, Strain CSIRO CS-38" /LENGTH=119 /DNA_ID=CAMNT_0010522475 /DNA_START=135 /DNA_END=491 /DNA_ORIENTATION=-
MSEMMRGSASGGYSMGLYNRMNHSCTSGWLPNSTRNVGQEKTAQTQRMPFLLCDVRIGPGLLNWFSKKPNKGLEAFNNIACLKTLAHYANQTPASGRLRLCELPSQGDGPIAILDATSE